jgi:glutathionylspermidine synthase
MERVSTTPRRDWQKTVESQGMHYHTADGIPYWDEGVYYRFTPQEVDTIEAATYALDAICLDAVQYALDHDLLDRFLIPRPYHDLIRRSWEEDEHAIYGRFDLAMDTGRVPKLLEYNADTPTALLEAAVVQWYWLKDCFPGCSQFNSIHERLLELFKELRGQSSRRFYFAAAAGSMEDYMTVNYLRDVAIQAGFATTYLDVQKIGWHARRRVFTDLAENAIELCVKLYPWEWMFREAFGPHLCQTKCRWFEPPWKALLSNKAILPLLWELNPRHPNLLETSFEPLPGGNYVKKPMLGREGANIQIFEGGKLVQESPGPYDGPAVYQETCPLPLFDDRHFALLGSWLVNGWACGMGIREDDSPITGNLSRFVPHVYGE